MLRASDVQELLGLPLVGVIPECKSVLVSTNMGQPVIMNDKHDAALAYNDAVDRFLGRDDIPFKFLTPKPRGILSKLFGE
jgi:septum site-determining protein MinD